MDRHNDECKAVNDLLKGLWDKSNMNDAQRMAANSYACGLIHGLQMQRGEKKDERKQQQNG